MDPAVDAGSRKDCTGYQNADLLRESMESPESGKLQYPEILGGDVDKQILALRDHLFTLGGGKVTVK